MAPPEGVGVGGAVAFAVAMVGRDVSSVAEESADRDLVVTGLGGSVLWRLATADKGWSDEPGSDAFRDRSVAGEAAGTTGEAALVEIDGGPDTRVPHAAVNSSGTPSNDDAMRIASGRRMIWTGGAGKV